MKKYFSFQIFSIGHLTELSKLVENVISVPAEKVSAPIPIPKFGCTLCRFTLPFFVYSDHNQKLLSHRKSKQSKLHDFFFILVDSTFVKTCDELYL